MQTLRTSDHAGRDTAGRLLAAAERLFAAHDYDAVSTRDIVRTAKANLAAVNYHFGGKAGLYRAVFLRRLEPANRRRIERLDEAERAAAGSAVPLRRILEILLAPVFEVGAESPGDVPPFVQLMARTFMAPHREISKAIQAEMTPVIRRFLAAMARSVPELGPETLRLRFRLIFGAALGGFATLPQQAVGSRSVGAGASDLKELERQVLSFLEAGFRAP